MKQFNALEYARISCDTMMRRYAAADLPPKGHFHYHQGVFLSGVYQTYRQTGNETYFQYIKDWVDSCLDEQGNVLFYEPHHLDDIQPGILLFPLYERTKEQKYWKALQDRMAILNEYPCNPEGGFWHMDIFANQMWLDGLYMAGPICAEYAYRFHEPKYFDIAVQQALLMQEKTRDPEKGLWYHAWDYTKNQEWANPVTGCSAEFWGRSMGWVPIAALSELEYLPKSHPGYDKMCLLTEQLLTALCRYQSASGLWYQVVDKSGEPGNWPEISCSCLYTAAILKAVRMGILDKQFLAQAQKGYEGVLDSLRFDGENLLVGGVCIGTGVGDYNYYCSRPTSENDLHGVGAFLIMCNEAYQMN